VFQAGGVQCSGAQAVADDEGDDDLAPFGIGLADHRDLAHPRVAQQGFFDLDAPIARVCTEEVPIPYPKHLEDAALPGPERIVATVRRLFSDAQ